MGLNGGTSICGVYGCVAAVLTILDHENLQNLDLYCLRKRTNYIWGVRYGNWLQRNKTPIWVQWARAWILTLSRIHCIISLGTGVGHSFLCAGTVSALTQFCNSRSTNQRHVQCCAVCKDEFGQKINHAKSMIMLDPCNNFNRPPRSPITQHSSNAPYNITYTSNERLAEGSKAQDSTRFQTLQSTKFHLTRLYSKIKQDVSSNVPLWPHL